MSSANILFQLSRSFNPMDSLARVAKLRSLQQDNALGEQSIDLNQAKLDDIARQNQERQIFENAATSAWNPATATLDRTKYTAALPAHLAMGAQNQFATQDAQAQKDALDMRTKIQALDKQSLDMGLTRLKAGTQMLGSLLTLPEEVRPQAYTSMARNLKQKGFLDPNHPEQYQGEAALRAELAQGLSAEQIFQQEKDQRDFKYQQEQDKLKQSNADRMYKLEVRKLNESGGGGGGSIPPIENTPVDPNSQSILAQTGLSLNAFRVLTGQASSLPRDAATRNRASQEAQNWANKNGIDVSTMASQYQAANKVLQNNIERMNSTKIMENELEGTIQNLKQVAPSSVFANLRFTNVAKIWAGQEVNDPVAQQYAMHLYQLRNELAAYGAATQGRTGNNVTLQDMAEAEKAIKDGISKGSLDGLEQAVKNSTSKMGGVMQNSVNAAQKQVWGLFGKGDRFKPRTESGSTDTGGGDPFAKFGGTKRQ